MAIYEMKGLGIGCQTYIVGNAHRVPGVYLLYYVSGHEENKAYPNNLATTDVCEAF